MNESQHQKQIFKSVFKGRRDGFGEGAGKCTKKPFADEIISSHLQGRRRVGVYPLSPDILDGSGTYWACIDVDTDDLNLAIEVTNRLHQLGVVSYIERSKSKGYHIWVFFSEPVPAREARALMAYATDRSKLEIFPKQTTIKTGNGYGYGNYVNLPLFGKDVKDNRTVFLNPEKAYEVYPDQWRFLDSIKRVSPQQVKDLIETGELEVGEDIAVSEDAKETKDAGEYTDMLPCVGRMMQGVSEGCRDEVCFNLAKHWRVEKGLPKEATRAILLEWNQKNKPPLDAKEIEASVESAYQGKGGKGYTSFGCENLLIQEFCDKANCPIFKEHDKETAKIPKQARSPYFEGNTFIPAWLAESLMNEYSFIYAGSQLYVHSDGVYSSIGEDFIDQQCREKLGKESRVNRVNEVVAHIKVFSHVNSDNLNKDIGLINVKNGILNWQSGELLTHSEEHLSTIQIPVTYDPQARCDQIDLFLMTTLPPDCLYIAEEIFGYCLIPDTKFQKAFMLTGSGRNGKSTFLDLLEAFIGEENVSKVPLQEICDHKFKRAELFGKMLNTFADLDAKSLQSSTYFKTIVAGDAIDAERKNQQPFFFRPFARLVFSTNEIPRSPDRSFAYYDRWCIIPFPNQFILGANADKDILLKLTSKWELSGLLNRALAGLRRLMANGAFTESETVQQALVDYKKSNDTVMAFCLECVEKVEDGRIERTKLYDSYVGFCHNEGFNTPASRQAVYTKMRALGISEIKDDKGVRWFNGIVVK